MNLNVAIFSFVALSFLVHQITSDECQFVGETSFSNVCSLLQARPGVDPCRSSGLRIELKDGIQPTPLGGGVGCNVTRANTPITISCTSLKPTVIRCSNESNSNDIIGCYYIPLFSSNVALSLIGCVYVGGPVVSVPNCTGCNVSLTSVTMDGERWLGSDDMFVSLYDTDYPQILYVGVDMFLSLDGCMIRNASQAILASNLKSVFLRNMKVEYVYGMGTHHTAVIDLRIVNRTVVENLEVIHSHNSPLENNADENYGGCLLLGGMQHLELRDSTFRDCHSSGSGGAVGMEVFRRATIENIAISNSMAYLHGGAMLISIGSNVVMTVRGLRLINVKAAVMAAALNLYVQNNAKRSTVDISDVYAEAKSGLGCIVLSSLCVPCTPAIPVIVNLKRLVLKNCSSSYAINIGPTNTNTRNDIYIRDARVRIFKGVSATIQDRMIQNRSSSTKTLSFQKMKKEKTVFITKSKAIINTTVSKLKSIASLRSGKVINETVASLASRWTTAAASLLLTSPEIALSSQLVDLSACDGDTSQLRRPFISLARVFPRKKSDKIDDDLNPFMDDAWEVVMLFVTSATLYIVHIIVTVFCGHFVFRKKVKSHITLIGDHSNDTRLCFVYSVSRCVYPGSSIRYHMSVFLPMMSSCIAGTYAVSTMNIRGVLISGMVVYVVVLILFHYNAWLNLWYVEQQQKITPASQNKSTLPDVVAKWFMACGTWNPPSSVSFGGPFFSSYTRQGGGLAPPHMWLWISLGLGVVMSMVSTVAEIRGQDSYWKICSV
eukprot:PhF_6_TR41348/c0_g2_i2/m.62766